MAALGTSWTVLRVAGCRYYHHRYHAAVELKALPCCCTRTPPNRQAYSNPVVSVLVTARENERKLHQYMVGARYRDISQSTHTYRCLFARRVVRIFEYLIEIFERSRKPLVRVQIVRRTLRTVHRHLFEYFLVFVLREPNFRNKNHLVIEGFANFSLDNYYFFLDDVIEKASHIYFSNTEHIDLINFILNNLLK